MSGEPGQYPNIMTTKDTGYFTIPSGIDKSVAEEIKRQLSLVSLSDGETQGDGVQPEIRINKICWIPTDHWIAGMMAHFINQANILHFKYDLHAWSDQIQYTVYDTPGAKYNWHTDHIPSIYHEGMWRKLSISLCLDDEYEGGELQLLTGHKHMETIKMKCGDTVVFSSDMMHRVKPIKSGLRSSLVGWYAGPKFK